MKKILQIGILTAIFLGCYNTKEIKQPEAPKEAVVAQSPKESAIQEPSDFDLYFTPTEIITTVKGPKNITRNILQDRKGNIWLATWEGLMRYDGTSFTNITNQERLRRYRAFDLLEDRNGHLWIATIGAGVYHYDGTTFTNYTSAEGVASDRVTNLYEDQQGKIWVGSELGISVFDGQRFQNIGTEHDLLNTDVNSIIQDDFGKFWIGTRGTAYWFDGKTVSTIISSEGKQFSNVRKIIKDSNGNMWLGGNDGLWRYDGSSFLNYTKNFVGYIHEDKKGNIWTSSQGSTNLEWVITRYDAKPMNVEKATGTIIKTENNMFFGILEDRAGGIWLGHLRGVMRYDGEDFNPYR